MGKMGKMGEMGKTRTKTNVAMIIMDADDSRCISI